MSVLRRPIMSFSKYPAVSRDLTLIAKEQVAYQGILEEIKSARDKRA